MVAMLEFKERKEKQFWRCVFNELLSTFFFVFITNGYALEQNNISSKRGSSVLVGFTVLILTLVGTKDHGYFNPVVTIALFIQGKLNLIRLLVFIPVQMAGALIGMGFLHVFIPEKLTNEKLELGFHPNVGEGNGFAIEVTLTFFFIWTVCATVDPVRNVAIFPRSLATGFAFAASTYYGLPLVGAGLNPVRAFASAVFTNNWKHQRVYWAGPLVGSISASLVYKYLLKFDDQNDEKQNTDPIKLDTKPNQVVVNIKTESRETIKFQDRLI